MNPRLDIRLRWDGSYSLFLDGQVILERKSREECLKAAEFIDCDLIVGSLPRGMTGPGDPGKQYE